MTSAAEYDTSFLAMPDQASLPMLRFMLRSIIANNTYKEVLLDIPHTCFHAVGPALVWDKPMLLALCNRLSKVVEGRHPAHADDAIALCKLLFSHKHEVGKLYQSVVLNKWRRQPEVIKRAFSETLTALESELVRQMVQHPNLAHLSALYGLDTLETEILEFALTLTERALFRRYLWEMRFESKASAWRFAATMMSCSVQDLRTALKPTSTLRACGLIHLDVNPNDLDGFIRVGPMSLRLSVFKAESREALQNEVLQPVAPPSLTLADFPHLENEFNWIVQCLQTAVRTRETGVNILIQGPSGTGKTQFACLLVQAAGLCGFEVGVISPYVEPSDGIGGLLEHYCSIQGILRTHPGAVLIFRETGTAAYYCDRLLKDRLETCTIPTIWISDEPTSMDDSILRRFVFHLELHNPPIGPRRHLVSQVTSGIAIEPDKLESIAADTSITPAQLKMAARFARLLTEGGPESRAQAFLSAVDASQRVNARALEES
ncbi:MAG: hypothetical protein ACOYNZ_17400 [Rhodoferax sp.]